MINMGTSLAIQWLRLHASNSGGIDLSPGQATKIPHVMQCSQKKRFIWSNFLKILYLFIWLLQVFSYGTWDLFVAAHRL